MKKLTFQSIFFDKSNNYIKRIVTLWSLVHMFLGSLIYTALFPILIFYVAKGNIELVKVMDKSFMQILYWDFMLTCVGIGVLTTKDFSLALIETAKAKSRRYDSFFDNSDNKNNIDNPDGE